MQNKNSELSKDDVFTFFSGRYELFYNRFVNIPGKSAIVKIPSPFRKEKQPSFQIHFQGPFEGRWHDFGSGEDGDIFDFYQLINKTKDDFPNILKTLCRDFNINSLNLANIKTKKSVTHISSTQDAKSYPLDWIKPYQDALIKNQYGGLDYLYSRGLLDETIKEFCLGVDVVTVEQNELPCILIPHIKDNKILLLKKRTFPEKHYLREKGMFSCLFGGHLLAKTVEKIYICEGEFDAMILWQCAIGPAISGTTGAGSFKTDWIEKLKDFKEIVIVYDTDIAGKEGSLELAKRIGETRTKVVKFPSGIKDVNDLYLKSNKDGIYKLLKTALPVPIKNVQNLSDSALEILTALKSGTIEKGYPWPWDNMTSTFGNLVPGRLIELSGAPGLGKTTLGIQVATFLASELKIPSHICCLEMTPAELTNFVIQQLVQISNDEISIDTLEYFYDISIDWPLFFEYHDTFVTIDNVLNVISQSYKRFGIKFVLVDNLHALSRTADNELKEEGKISLYLKRWAVANNAVVFLIVHPRKIEAGKLETLSDIRGNAAITGDCDAAFTLWRKNLQPKTEEDLLNNSLTPLWHPITCVLQTKGRFGSGAGKVWLFNEGEFRRFRKIRETDDLPSINTNKSN